MERAQASEIADVRLTTGAGYQYHYTRRSNDVWSCMHRTLDECIAALREQGFKRYRIDGHRCWILPATGRRRVVWVGDVPERCELCDGDLNGRFVDGPSGGNGMWACACERCHKQSLGCRSVDVALSGTFVLTAPGRWEKLLPSELVGSRKR